VRHSTAPRQCGACIDLLRPPQIDVSICYGRLCGREDTRAQHMHSTLKLRPQGSGTCALSAAYVPSLLHMCPLCPLHTCSHCSVPSLMLGTWHIWALETGKTGRQRLPRRQCIAPSSEKPDFTAEHSTSPRQALSGTPTTGRGGLGRPASLRLGEPGMQPMETVASAEKSMLKR
jgi:hypothetical protein